MIRHQAIPTNPHRAAFQRFFDDALKRRVVFWLAEDPLSPHATIQYMVNVSARRSMSQLSASPNPTEWSAKWNIWTRPLFICPPSMIALQKYGFGTPSHKYARRS